jgi:hypothetical protein
MAELAIEGISKDKVNSQQGYKFRGIDDVYNALAPVLAKEKLLILPRVLTRNEEERVTAKGGRLAFVTVHMEFDFVSGQDGSKHTVSTFGEAMDSADKATNKAMSAAFKYAAFQAFCIPTEAHDADATTYEVRPKGSSEQPPDDEPVSRVSEVDRMKLQQQKLAGDWLKKIGLGKEEFANFQAACALGTRTWEAIALMAQDEDVEGYDDLMAYLAGKSIVDKASNGKVEA